MTVNAEYLHLKSGAALPALWVPPPFRAVVVAETAVPPQWQSEVSDWLVRAGCLYMMAWGENCSSWDDAVDMANLEQFDFGEIPREQFVMTTWHEHDALEEVFRFAKNSAVHPAARLDGTLLLHIAPGGDELRLMEVFFNA
ncbi:MAG TPA: hypothetical protein VIU46_10870 [Gallionellaceae bacterium]